jgi:hypothetical protein
LSGEECDGFKEEVAVTMVISLFHKKSSAIPNVMEKANKTVKNGGI